MKQQYDLIMYISVLEDSIAPQMKMFENSVRARWHSLPDLEANTIYHICPYFGHINSDIENFFETGLMRIAHNISRQYTSFSEKELELSWFGINSNYSDLLDQYCTPFVEAFEAASSGGLNRLNQARVDMERTSSDRRYGYITNSFTYMLAAETVNAIASAMRAVENDRQAWQVATAPQQVMHNKLTSLWSKNFEPVFMKQIEAEDVLVSKEIIEHLCLASNFTYETYENAKNNPVFSSEKAQFIAKLSAEKQNSESEKKNEREQIISQLNAEISAIDEKLVGLGFSLWGDKRKERKILEQKKSNFLQKQELQLITFLCPQLMYLRFHMVPHHIKNLPIRCLEVIFLLKIGNSFIMQQRKVILHIPLTAKLYLYLKVIFCALMGMDEHLVHDGKLFWMKQPTQPLHEFVLHCLRLINRTE